jgi:hypothetical protein
MREERWRVRVKLVRLRVETMGWQKHAVSVEGRGAGHQERMLLSGLKIAKVEW